MSGIIELMKAMGYEDVSTGGVCFGLAQGLIQAHLSGEKDWIEIHKMLALLKTDQIKRLVVGGKKIEKDAEGPTYLDTGAIKNAEETKSFIERSKKKLTQLENDDLLEESKRENLKRDFIKLKDKMTDYSKKYPCSRVYGLPEKFTNERLCKVRAFLDTVYMYQDGYKKEKEFLGTDSVKKYSQRDLYVDKVLDEEKNKVSRVYCHDKGKFRKLMRSMQGIKGPVGFDIRLIGHAMGLVYNGNQNWTLVNHDVLEEGSIEKIAEYLFKSCEKTEDCMDVGGKKSIIYELTALVKPENVRSYFDRPLIEKCERIMNGVQAFNAHEILEGLKSSDLLLRAASIGDIKSTQECMKANFDINAQDNKGRTALMIAVEKGNTATVELLLAHRNTAGDLDVAVNTKDENGKTALMIAVQKGNLEAVKAILKSKQYNVLNAQDRAKFLNATDKLEDTALKSAVFMENQEIVEALLGLEDKLGKPLIDINATDESGNTLLMDACTGDNVEEAKFLIRIGADVDKKNKKNETALINECQLGNFEMAECLILGKANLDEKDDYGKTALMYACERGEVQLAKLLIVNEADIYSQDNRKNTAYDYLKQKIKSNEISELSELSELFDLKMEYAKKKCKVILDKMVPEDVDELENSSDISPELSPELKGEIEKAQQKYKKIQSFSEIKEMVEITDDIQKLERCKGILTDLSKSSDISPKLKEEVEKAQQKYKAQQQYKKIKSFSEIKEMVKITDDLQKEAHKQAIKSAEEKEKVDQIVLNAKKSSKKDEVELAEKIKILHTMKLPIDTEILGQYVKNGDMQQMKDSLEDTMRKDIASRREILTGLKENENLSEEVKRQIEKDKILKDDKFLDAESQGFDDIYVEYCKISQIQEHAEKVIAIQESVRQLLRKQESTDSEQEGPSLDEELQKAFTSIHEGSNGRHRDRIDQLVRLHQTVLQHEGKIEELKASIMEHGKIKQEKENFSSKSLIVALGAIAVAAGFCYGFGSSL